MAETTETAAQQSEVTETQDVGEVSIESLQAELDKAKAESRKWEKRAKDNKAAADELETMRAERDTSQTEYAKAVEKAEAATAELEVLRAEKARAESVKAAAKEFGVDEDLLSMMAGDSDDQIRSNAEILKLKLDAIPKYPSIEDHGGNTAPAITKDQILSIENPNERYEAIKQNAQLFRK